MKRLAYQQWVKSYRRRLGAENALLPLSFLGIFVGLLTGGIIQVFRFAIEWPGDYWLGNHEHFEALSPDSRFVLVLFSALALGLFLQFIVRKPSSIGLLHVVQHLNKHHGRLPMRGLILQFIVGIWTILSGQSSGREGPAVHLGAAASSLLGQYWKLPSNSLRVLIGCGSAAAIAASFNTPIAGVIFAMEVIMLEYSITGFIPVMLSASAGTLISRIIYGAEPAFIIPPLAQHSLFELPAFIALGVACGTGAAVFCSLHKQGLRLHKYLPLWSRITLAGFITAGFGFYVPEVLGMGYDSLDLALASKMGVLLLLAIGVSKILVTAASSGLGMPISTIGPSLVAGGCLGGAMGVIINFLAPVHIANDSFYVMLGMGAMMGAVLNAPLAALIALLELTNTPDIILPALIAIITATLLNSTIFKQKPPHIASLDFDGQRSHLSMFEITLQKISASSLMNKNLRQCQALLQKTQLLDIIDSKPRWVLVSDNNQQTLLNGTQLAKSYEEDIELQELATSADINLLSLPGEQIIPAMVHFQDSALEVWQAMEQANTTVAYISGAFDAYAPEISGIITRQDLEDFYQKPRLF